MSISDESAGRANHAENQNAGLSDPSGANAAAGQDGQKQSKGLPGLAGFGQMQAYTAAMQPSAHDMQSQQPVEDPGEMHQHQDDYAVSEEPAHEASPAGIEPDAGYPGGNDASLDYTYAEQGAALADDGANGAGEYAANLQERLDSYSQDAPLPEDHASSQDSQFTGDPASSQDAQFAGDPAPFQDSQIPGDVASSLDSRFPDDFASSQDSQFPGDSASEELQNIDEVQGHSDAQPYGDYAAGAAGTDQDIDPQNALQTFEARYDQHPEVALGSFDEGLGEQPFYNQNGQADAEFGAEMADDDLADEELRRPGERRGRKALMVASGLIGALALGGALAFAYKTGGGAKLASGDAPPLIQADNRPVKVAPEEPGGKQFPHQNKQIYDRLQGDQKPEVEKLVPRQEEVAATAAPGGARLDSDVATPAQQQIAAADIKAAEPAVPGGGPHKVRTLQVKPDGTFVAPQETAAATPQPAVPALPAPGASVAVTMPATPAQPPAQPAVQPDPVTTASVSQPAAPQAPAAAPQPQPGAAAVVATPAPLPQQKPATQTAAAPAAQAAPGGSIFVVQVASRRSQSLALAAFADLQQKYTSLLGNYQPMIQSADLGAKGTWYRLRVGPMSKKAEAATLCKSLKRAGLRSCLVRPL